MAGWNIFPTDQSVDPSADSGDQQMALGSLKSGLGKFGGPVGDVLAGATDIFAGIQGQQQANNQAERYYQQSKLDLYDAGREVQAQETKGVQTIGLAEASAGAGGVTQGGSVGNAIRASVQHANEADIVSRFAGKVRNVNDIYEAQQQRYAGKQAMLGGLLKGTMSFIKAGTSLAGGPVPGE